MNWKVMVLYLAQVIFICFILGYAFHESYEKGFRKGNFQKMIQIEAEMLHDLIHFDNDYYQYEVTHTDENGMPDVVILSTVTSEEFEKHRVKP